MFNGKESEIFYFVIIFPPIFLLIRPHRSQIFIKIMILVLRVNLGVILPFSVDYSYLQVNL